MGGGYRHAGAVRTHARPVLPAAHDGATPGLEPPVDVMETETQVLILIALPGVECVAPKP